MKEELLDFYCFVEWEGESFDPFGPGVLIADADF